MGGHWYSDSEQSFLNWAVSAGPMVWRHVRQVMLGVGLPLGLMGTRQSRGAPYRRWVTFLGAIENVGNPLRGGFTFQTLLVREGVEMLSSLIMPGSRIEDLWSRNILAGLSVEVWEALRRMGVSWVANGPSVLGEAMVSGDEQEGAVERGGFLLNEGADPCALDQWGELWVGVLMGLSAGGYGYPGGLPFTKELVDFLQSNGADPHARNKRGENAWHAWVGEQVRWERDGEQVLSAQSRGRWQYLVDNGVNINAQDTKGQTPLHWWASARFETRPCMLGPLVEAGADLSVVNHQGMTPLALARFENRRVAVEAMEEMMRYQEAQSTREGLMGGLPEAGAGGGVGWVRKFGASQ
jgi:hypothetical protein